MATSQNIWSHTIWVRTDLIKSTTFTNTPDTKWWRAAKHRWSMIRTIILVIDIRVAWTTAPNSHWPSIWAIDATRKTICSRMQCRRKSRMAGACIPSWTSVERIWTTARCRRSVQGSDLRQNCSGERALTRTALPNAATGTTDLKANQTIARWPPHRAT